MSINDNLLKLMKCCLDEDEHIALDPVLVIECQNNACKRCIIDSKEENIYCYGCKNNHEKTNLLIAPSNKFVEEFIKCFSNDLFACVDEKLKASFESLKSK